ncbi:hypothetical protein [Lentzea sp. NEAU-D7]|uniref:hypothetical protein n=1 Tax=Lentzea sp. NEAU-D7 TaxID=2994667 RepID=UPI00224ADE80|nr:hypothetical protein [Lentzea sp. NEAU-D7]MCX2949746.1 hypothetical protein [Lentzea sp. NEAU-D7]
MTKRIAIDTSVPMQRLGQLDFVPTRESFTPAPSPTMGAVVLIGAGIWWQDSRSRRQSPRAEVRRLRRHVRWYVGAGPSPSREPTAPTA